MFTPHRYTTRMTTFCVALKSGRTYLVRPVYSEDVWRPEVIDETTARRIGMRFLAPYEGQLQCVSRGHIEPNIAIGVAGGRADTLIR